MENIVTINKKVPGQKVDYQSRVFIFHFEQRLDVGFHLLTSATEDALFLELLEIDHNT